MVNKFNTFVRLPWVALCRALLCLAVVSVLVLTNMVNAFAYSFPDGSVQGLPQNLVVMDENGHSPNSENGELYIYIDSMLPGEVYTKDITVSNFRDDAVYTVRMRATPNYTRGNIDLINEVECKLYLDDSLIYQGRVDGDGTPNMQTNGIRLGDKYEVNESRKLHAEFVWNITDETSELMATYAGEDSGYYGEISFNWIFSAEVILPGSGTSSGLAMVNTPMSNTGENTGNVPGHPQDEPASPALPNEEDVSNTPDTDIENDNSITPIVSDSTEDVPNIDKQTQTYKKIDKLITNVVGKLPFIPEDVKTGYQSEIVFYTKVLAVTAVVALGILAAIVCKCRKLKRLKCLDELDSRA
jgi:hypothetical protein